MPPTPPICLFLSGDVMTGRGVDQVMLTPVNPVLYEDFIRDARDYVELAERASGPIPHPVEPAYIWGEALEVLQQADTDVRIINLETSITTSEDAWPDKGINYRMHPRNIGCLSAARIDCCALANNHVLDWGYAGLVETLETLDAAGIARAGAGRNLAEAAAPAILDVPGKGRVLVFSLGSPTSGIPRGWGATAARPGVHLLEDLSEPTARRVAAQMQALKQPGDVVVASIHWGPNWGYDIPEAQRGLAHGLIAGGVDVVHGHSSHHPKACEVHQERLILYGCGDLLDDYEGISGYEEFRPELRLIYLVRLDPQQGRLVEARVAPMRIGRFRLARADAASLRWLSALLARLEAPFGVRVSQEPGGTLTLSWPDTRPRSPGSS
jgi:poly-gamma-glutamate synthesis protein (capsule biosynthesis protein)